jgi:hypothetical protein
MNPLILHYFFKFNQIHSLNIKFTQSIIIIFLMNEYSFIPSICEQILTVLANVPVSGPVIFCDWARKFDRIPLYVGENTWDA